MSQFCFIFQTHRLYSTAFSGIWQVYVGRSVTRFQITHGMSGNGRIFVVVLVSSHRADETCLDQFKTRLEKCVRKNSCHLNGVLFTLNTIIKIKKWQKKQSYLKLSGFLVKMPNDQSRTVIFKVGDSALLWAFIVFRGTI